MTSEFSNSFQPTASKLQRPSDAWQSAIGSLLENHKLSPSLEMRKKLLSEDIYASTMQRFKLKETSKSRSLSCLGNGEVTALHIPSGLLIPELGLRGEIWGMQCRLKKAGEFGRYQRVFSGAETKPHFIGIDRFNSWEEFLGKSLGMKALVVTQSSLEALSLYQAARKDVVVVSIGENISLPIDPMILRLGEEMPVLLAHQDECKGKDWFRRWKGLRVNKRRKPAFNSLRSLLLHQPLRSKTIESIEWDSRFCIKEHLR